MTRLFDDEQSSSLITSMMNPESNASKFIEQGEDIGLPRDVTMDILNKYATYGANTGIGNLGGERLVNALNEEYRKRVDEPLQDMPREAFLGGLAEFLSKLGTAAADITKIKELFGGAKTVSSDNLAALDAAATPGVEAGAIVDAGATGGALNSPVTSGSENTLIAETTRLERFQKYLDDNPEVAKILQQSGRDVGKIIGQAIGGGDEKRKTPIRAPRPRFQPGQVRTQRVGMAAGGKPEEGSVLGRKLFIQGGEVDGPGGPKEDLVPIWASDSEYVVSEKGVRNMGGGDFEKGIAALDKINFGKRNV